MKGSEVMADIFFALGTIHLSTYLKTFKVGDIVDIKVGLFILHLSILTQGCLCLKSFGTKFAICLSPSGGY